MSTSTSQEQQQRPLLHEVDPKRYGAVPLDSPTADDNVTRDATVTSRSPSTASWLSKLLFSYANPVLALGNTRQLHQDDLWQLEGDNCAHEAYRRFETQFHLHNESVARTLLATYGWSFFACGVGSLVTAACGVFAPIVLHHVIDAFSAPTVDTHDLARWLGAFFASRLLNAFVSAHVDFRIQNLLIQVTVSLKSLLFAKAMRRSTQAKHAADSVDISNLFTTDMDGIIWCGQQLNALWIMPLQIAAILYLLYNVLGLAVLAGVGVIVASLGVNMLLAMSFMGAYETLSVIKDSRMRSVKEAFGAIQIVKLNAWEPHFLDRIRSWRTKELAVLAKYLYVVQVAIFLFFTTPMCVSVASFAAYTLVMQQSLTAAKVFTAMVLFGALRSPLANLPEAAQTFVQARVSLQRIQTFLRADNVDRSCVTHDATAYADSTVIAMENVSIRYTMQSPPAAAQSDSDRSTTSGDANTASATPAATIINSNGDPVLSNVNLCVKRGDLVVVHGAVGAGKSSLCAALLGEIPITHGTVFVRRSGADGGVAYYSQQPWIQNMSVRDNILFGQAFDAVRYERVLDACGLVPDIQQLPAGDATEIGQRGVNLSGGQKARLSLARACYSDADVFILDAPLAAVDAVVQSEIFRKCICGLLERKTVVLVSHSPEILRSDAVDVRVEVADGHVRCERAPKQNGKSRRDAAASLVIRSTADSSGATAALGATDSDVGATLAPAPHWEPAELLIEDETRAKGRVSPHVYREYASALGGVSLALVLVLVLVVAQGFQVASDVWLSIWTGSLGASTATNGEAVTDAHQQASTQANFAIYALLGLTTAVFFLARAMLIAYIGLRASQYLFDAMTQSLLYAPIRFFDANPIGRIINRFADDTTAVDVELSFHFGGVLVSVVTATFQLATAVYVVRFAGVLLVPLVLLYARVTIFYLTPTREVARLLKVAGSPVLSHVAQCEEGIIVVRAFGKQFVDHAIAESARRIDANSRAWAADAIVNQWFSIRIQLVGCGVVCVIVSAIIWFKDTLSPGLVGLAFMYAVSVDEEILYLVRCCARLELAMVSPERMLEYVGIVPEGNDKVVTFDPNVARTTRGGREWPATGSVAFERVVFSYKPGAAPVLKDVSFAARSGEKVGIVGRTGAGKSSLTMALFRINELSSGRIVIDGVDVSTIALSVLRSRLSIIPQSPVLFKGSLRAYMDPFEAFSDAQIWAVLHKVGLASFVAALERTLWHELSEHGENLSVGERQLLCLARALLCESHVVVLDEATASIDHATEQRLQVMVAREFAAATVLTIAHRLATVLASDRILVLADGRAVEFDTPAVLAKCEGGAFRELVREGGYLDHFA